MTWNGLLSDKIRDMIQEEIYKLHQKYAGSKKDLDLVWAHSLIVRDIALELVENLIKKILG